MFIARIKVEIFRSLNNSLAWARNLGALPYAELSHRPQSLQPPRPRRSSCFLVDSPKHCRQDLSKWTVTIALNITANLGSVSSISGHSGKLPYVEVGLYSGLREMLFWRKPAVPHDTYLTCYRSDASPSIMADLGLYDARQRPYGSARAASPCPHPPCVKPFHGQKVERTGCF